MHLNLKTGRAIVALALITLMIPASALAGEMTASWKNGLKLADEDGNYVKIGGRMYVDWAWFSTDDDFDASASTPVDGTEFRTARLFLEGKMHEVIKYKLQIDVAGSSTKFKDAYISLTKTPLMGASLKVGQFKQPFGLEELTSSKYITFMERSQTAGFAIGRESGFQLGRAFAEDQATFHASIFRNVDDRGAGEGYGLYGFAARATGLAWQDDEGGLVHVGASFARINPHDGEAGYALEPESHFQDEFNEITVDVDATNLFGLEAAAVSGPFSVQGEFAMAQNTAPDGGEDASFNSFYGQASWFLTGESRAYKASSGAFNRVKPKANYGANGYGAFEVAARYSSTDLDDGNFEGGTLDALTFGANWYLNPNTRLMVNWVRSDGESTDATGVTNALQTRFQVDF